MLKIQLVNIDKLKEPSVKLGTIGAEHILNQVIPTTIGGTPPIVDLPAPIIAMPDGTIIDGVLRWKALKLAGVQVVYVVYKSQ